MTECLRHVFIGYDEREDLAYQVAKFSILSQLPKDSPEVKVYKLDHRTLRNLGLFTRTWTTNDDGTYKDNLDKRPFSTQFSHSRFLVPAYAKYLGLKGQALFVDCDFLFKGNINELFDLTGEQDVLLSCVKHEYKPDTTTKMDGMSQKAYTFKLWSAMMMFNLENAKLYELLEPSRVNTWDGTSLHRFTWISMSHQMVNSEIGEIPEAWHFIPDHSEERVGYNKIKAMHFTEGGPWFPHMWCCRYANDWWHEAKLYVMNDLCPFMEEMDTITRNQREEDNAY